MEADHLHQTGIEKNGAGFFFNSLSLSLFLYCCFVSVRYFFVFWRIFTQIYARQMSWDFNGFVYLRPTKTP